MNGYITIEYEGTERVDVEDILCEVSNELLKQEAIERGILLESKETVNGEAPLSGNKDDNRRVMCDLLGLNYHTNKEDIINELNERL